ncbi:catalase [Plutella xylostella]|uniref:catalase n=1 Tax=Plutella xylostella TaxID=51655 RepID=UPI002032B39E|nr:catalase [Plutella xylostella]
MTRILASVVSCNCSDPVSQQLHIFKLTHKTPAQLSLSFGSPVTVQQAASSLQTNLIRNPFFMETFAHLSIERIPERLVHAAGAGAFGHFRVTHDITHICKAKLFSAIGKKTPVAVRFSHVGGFRGFADSARDGRGFAIKFYTEDGNYDLLALNTPVFPVMDPLFFASFAHALHPNPQTGIMENNAQWDFLTLRPESVLFAMVTWSDRGTPDGFRHMPGFGVHAFQVVNHEGTPSFLRFHITPDAGMKNLMNEDAVRLAGEDPSYYARDLYNAIAYGCYPTWTVSAQILTLEQVKTASFDVFDVTKVLPTDKYPLQQIGILELNRNPENYFAEVEQIAFNPGNLVHGILGAPDKLFEGRLVSYVHDQTYRLNGNLNKIRVNAPLQPPSTYLRDGRSPVRDNELGTPDYFPNSFNGPVAFADEQAKLIEITQKETDNFGPAREFYLKEFTDKERETLPGNVVSGLRMVTCELQERVARMFSKVDKELGSRIRDGLNNSTITCGEL